MRWRILALLFFARIGLGFQFQTLASVGDDLVVAFGFDYAEIGFLIGLFMAPGLLLALPAGFAGRYACDLSLAGIGLVALTLGGVVSGCATEGWTIGLGRLIAGVGFVFGTVYFTKMIADWFDGREIATAMSIFVVSWPVGIAVGQIGHVWLAQTFDWHAPFLAASIYCGAGALAMFIWYRPPPNLEAANSFSPGLSVSLKALEWRLVICAGAAWGLFNAGYVVYLTFASKMLIAHGAPTLGAASVVSLGSWLMLLSATLCGMIADRFGRRDTIMMVCMAGAVIALMLLSVPGAGVPASMLFGLLGMAPAGVIMALAGQAIAPQRRAFGMGVFFTIYYASMTAGPPIAGAIFDLHARADEPLMFGMALFAAVLPATFAFRHFKSNAPSACRT